jgi:ribonuclease HII
MVKPDFNEELLLWNKGITHVIGLDEVGRGAFAGPLVAGAVVFTQDFLTKEAHILSEVTDSKLLKASVREKLAQIIKQTALAHAIAEIPVTFINRYGVGKANYAAFRKVIREIVLKLDSRKKTKTDIFFLLDGRSVKFLPFGGKKKQKAIVKGDQKSISIAAASIIAKVHRDSLMTQFDKQFSRYFFSKHKGYGTKLHQNALKKHGPCKLHRKAFIRKLLTAEL